jgi:hypothetical protein
MTDDVTAEVTARYGQREISDAAALTIASWWQSPSADGMPFTELSTTGSVDYEALCDAIHRERRELHNDTFNARALDMLSTWAFWKVRD